MTRRSVLGATLVSVGGVLAACVQAAGSTDGAPRPSGQPVTLRYLGRGNQVILDIQQRIVDDFEKANPRIKVQSEAASDNLQKLLIEIASGSTSDVAFTAMGSFRTVAKRDGLLALDRFMARDFKKGDYWYWIWANGGDIFTPDKTKSAIDSPVAVDTIQWMADLHTKQVIMPSPAFPDSNPTGFESGRIALQPHGRWSVAAYRQLGQFAWDVVPMPKGKAGRIGYGWFSGMSILQATKYQAEAWEFCKFCGTDPGQKVLAEMGQTVPPMPRLATSDMFLKSSPPANNRAYLEAIANVRIHPTAWIIESTDYNNILNPALNEVWLGAKPAKAALQPLVGQLNEVLARG